MGYSVLILDGDDVRNRLHTHLGFTEEDIKINNELIAGLCLTSRGDYDIIFVPIISPFESSRKRARKLLGKDFYEIYFSADLETVSARDVKGLYSKARRGEIPNLIGFSPGTPYEAPAAPEHVVHSGRETMKTCLDGFLRFVLRTLDNPSVATR